MSVEILELNYEHIKVDDSVGPVGAIVSGVDLNQEIAPIVMDEIRTAWLTHHVLFFKNQFITPSQQVNFAALFGELDVYPFQKSIEGHQNVLAIIKEADADMNFGGAWHTDTSYLELPPMATILHAIDVPEKGGDTLFANATEAFSSLSPAMRETLKTLKGIYSPKLVHSNEGIYSNVAAKNRRDEDYVGDSLLSESEVEHPIIRKHTETGRESIYCSMTHTHRIAGWTREESLPILNFLMEHATKTQYVTRFHWENGAIAVWDNRCLFHNALNDYQGQRRHMHRVIVRGDKPK